MARPPSICIEDVERAVETLRLQGKPINPYQIRKIIGEGSTSKIQWYLDGMQRVGRHPGNFRQNDANSLI